MTHKVFTLTTGDPVYVYDEVFAPNECYHFNLFAQNSLFRCDYNSSVLNENMTYATLTSPYNDADVDNFGFFKSKNYEKISKHFDGLERKSSWMTLIKMMPEVYYHVDQVDPQGMTLLFYVNMEWNLHYGGETIICNNKGEPELAIATKPNRVVIYSSALMHKPSGLSPKSPPNRFSFVSTFK